METKEIIDLFQSALYIEPLTVKDMKYSMKDPLEEIKPSENYNEANIKPHQNKKEYDHCISTDLLRRLEENSPIQPILFGNRKIADLTYINPDDIIEEENKYESSELLSFKEPETGNFGSKLSHKTENTNLSDNLFMDDNHSITKNKIMKEISESNKMDIVPQSSKSFKCTTASNDGSESNLMEKRQININNTTKVSNSSFSNFQPRSDFYTNNAPNNSQIMHNLVGNSNFNQKKNIINYNSFYNYYNLPNNRNVIYNDISINNNFNNFPVYNNNLINHSKYPDNKYPGSHPAPILKTFENPNMVGRRLLDGNKGMLTDDEVFEKFGKRGWICVYCNNFNYESKTN